jgi:beta-glucosidase-like glycosyl hydrolase
MNIKEKIGQLFSPAAFIHDSEENIQAMEKLIAEYHIGGLTFFHSRHSAAANFERRQENLSYDNTFEKLIELINRYQLVTKIPLLISIDAEFGLVMRIENTPQYPYAISLGAMDISEKEWIYEVGKRMARDLKAAGIHLNFAPVADINSNPDNPVIGYRSFGKSKEKVSEFSKHLYKGHQDEGVGACYKHFPGHGDTAVDSHLGLPALLKTKEELGKEELSPFQDGIAEGIDMVMVGHLAVPELTGGKEIPASVSKKLITDLLKKEMGFEGVIVSDALNMKAVANLYPEPGQLEFEAFMAGIDLLCFSENIKEGINWILERAPEERIEESFQKIMVWKEKYGVLNAKKVKVPVFDWESHKEFLGKLSPKFLAILKKVNGEIDMKNCSKVAVFGSKVNSFFKSLNELLPREPFELENLDKQFEELEDAEWVLVALFVPSAKPINHFGMNPATLKKLQLLAERKKVSLYIFGNPLALKEFTDLEQFAGVTCAFQDFEVVQKTAALHFAGQLQAEGTWDHDF